MNIITLHRRIVRYISILLTVCLVFSVMTLDAPEAYAADEPQAEATGQAPEEPTAAEETAPPSEEPPAVEETAAPSEEPPLAAASQPPVMIQTAEEPDIITAADGTQYARDEVIVKFKSTVSDSAIMSALDAADSGVINTLEAYGLTVAEVPEGETVNSFIDTLEAQPNVEYAEPNYVYKVAATVSDPGFSMQWYLNKINIPTAWDMTMGLPDIKVAVLDTGIDLTHPEFAGQIFAQEDMVYFDGNAQDDSIGEKCYGHGTHVAGIIGAKPNNGQGISGVAPGVSLIAVDVFDGDGAWTVDVIEGMQYAVANGADVINMSLGGPGISTSFEDAITDAVNKGVVCVVAAGNDNTSIYYSPSDCTDAISVIATDQNDNRASFSNYGPLKDISAPGVDILSTYPINKYAYGDGTSMAAPVVSGVVGLMLSANPSLTVNEVKNILYNTAVDLGTAGKDDIFGNGRVNAYEAVRESTQDYDVSVSKTLIGGTGSTYGTVSGGGNFTSCSSVTVNALAADHYHFVRWTDNGTEVSTNASYTFPVKKDINLTAEFELDWYSISAASNNSLYGSVSGGGKVYYGNSVTLTATPNTNCFFNGWVENGVTVSTDTSYTFTPVKSTTIQAIFIPSSFTITATPNNPSYGTVSGGGVYQQSDQIILVATPFPGHRFVRWIENGIEISSYYKYSLGVAGNHSIIAEFVPYTPITASFTKTDSTLYGGSNGTITVTPSGGDSGRYMYAIDGRGWYASNVFTELRAGVYTITVCDWYYNESTTSFTVTIGQPASLGVVPAKSIPSKPKAGASVTIVPPAAPRGYTTTSVTYSSTNPTVASVDASGNVTFLAGGKATIITKVVSQTVDKKGKIKTKTTTVKKTVTVQQPVSSISLNLGNTTIARTQKVKLMTGISPATASNRKVKWTSSNPKVASVSSSGVVTGKSGGTAVITCRAADGSGASASCTVNVTPIYTTGVKMNKAALTVKLGKTASLKATVAPKNTDFKTVTWASSNPAVATVDAKGKVRAVASGTAVITATTNCGQVASCTVTVP